MDKKPGPAKLATLNNYLKVATIDEISYLHSRYCGSRNYLLACKKFGDYADEARKAIADAYLWQALEQELLK